MWFSQSVIEFDNNSNNLAVVLRLYFKCQHVITTFLHIGSETMLQINRKESPYSGKFLKGLISEISNITEISENFNPKANIE